MQFTSAQWYYNGLLGLEGRSVATKAASLAAANTQMFTEAGSAGAVVAQMLGANRALADAIGVRLRERPPAFVVGIGRGSSDHAGVYAKYLIEQRLGVVSAAAGLSLSSVYHRTANLSQALCLAISQSGKSPDLIAMVSRARKAGARTLALVNDADSPLAQAVEDVLPLHAGTEQSVAATKSFIASLAASALLVGHWAQDEKLLSDLDRLPEALDRAWQLDWSALDQRLSRSKSLYVLGRGASYATAREAALKFKETCAIHAEAFSSAEVLHGPAALAGSGFAVLAFCQDDEARPGMEDTLAILRSRGADVLVAGAEVAGTTMLPTLDLHPLLQPIAMAVSFYRSVNALAVELGRDPDRPPHLSKVTETF